MILAIDIGNTKIKLGLFKNKQLVHSSNFDNEKSILNKLSSLNKHSIKSAIISSVVPELTPIFKDFLEKKNNIKPLIVDSNNSNLFLDVNEPSTIGADRLCNIKATIELYSAPVIIIDFGTATTFDVVNKKNKFIGGIIAPGVETSAKYLINKAALLHEVDFTFPKKIIGTNTKTNIQSGIMFGAVEQISGLVKRINKETKITNNIVLTGGFSKLLSPYLSFNYILDIDLTLKGMLFINESHC